MCTSILITDAADGQGDMMAPPRASPAPPETAGWRSTERDSDTAVGCCVARAVSVIRCMGSTCKAASSLCAVGGCGAGEGEGACRAATPLRATESLPVFAESACESATRFAGGAAAFTGSWRTAVTLSLAGWGSCGAVCAACPGGLSQKACGCRSGSASSVAAGGALGTPPLMR